MKKINYILLVLLICTSSCGYRAINNLNSYNFIISDYELTGDKKINFILDKNFKRFNTNENSNLKFKILGTSKKNISILSKDISKMFHCVITCIHSTECIYSIVNIGSAHSCDEV